MRLHLPLVQPLLHFSILPAADFQASLQRDLRSSWQAVPLSLFHSLGQVSEGYCWLQGCDSFELWPSL